MTSKVQGNLRVILAIAGKDIVDAIKNKSILSQVLTVAFIIVFYRFLPAFESGDELPRLALYDAGGSQLTPKLENSESLDLVEFSTQEAMQAYIEDGDIVVLGLVLPSELDRQINARKTIQLEGYVVHWASDKKTVEATEFFEEEITELTGSPTKIHTDGNIVYSIPDSNGLAFQVSLSAVLALVIAGVFIVPILVLEEKQNKTLDALLVSPADPNLVVLGKALSGSLYCAITAVAVLAVNHALVTQWGLAIVAALCGVFFCVSLGLLLGSVFEVKQQVTLWGFVLINVLGIPLFLSRMDDIIPAGVMTVIHLMPSVALAKIFRVSFSNSVSFNLFGPNVAIVLGGTAIVLAVVVWIVRRSDR